MLGSTYCPILVGLELGYAETAEVDSRSNGEQLAIVRSYLALDLHSEQGNRKTNALSWQHRYTQLQQQGSDPLHNGHLHESVFHWQSIDEKSKDWQHDWSLGLAMSSNRFKSIQPASDALVIEGESWRKIALQRNLWFELGIQANYLFNRYRVLPSIGVLKRYANGELLLNSRRLHWSHRWSDRQTLSLWLGRTATKWFVEDNDSGADSDVYLRAKIYQLEYGHRLSDRWRVALSLGLTQARQLNFQDRLLGHQSLKFASAPTFGIALYRDAPAKK